MRGQTQWLQPIEMSAVASHQRPMRGERRRADEQIHIGYQVALRAEYATNLGKPPHRCLTEGSTSAMRRNWRNPCSCRRRSRPKAILSVTSPNVITLIAICSLGS